MVIDIAQRGQEGYNPLSHTYFKPMHFMALLPSSMIKLTPFGMSQSVLQIHANFVTCEVALHYVI